METIADVILRCKTDIEKAFEDQFGLKNHIEIQINVSHQMRQEMNSSIHTMNHGRNLEVKSICGVSIGLIDN